MVVVSAVEVSVVVVVVMVRAVSPDSKVFVGFENGMWTVVVVVV